MGEGDGSPRCQISSAVTPSPEFSITKSPFFGKLHRSRNAQQRKKARSQPGLVNSIRRFVSRNLKVANEIVDPVLLVPAGNSGVLELRYSDLFKTRCLSCNEGGLFELSSFHVPVLNQYRALKENVDVKYTRVMDLSKVEVPNVRGIVQSPLQNVEQDSAVLETERNPAPRTVSVKQASTVATGQKVVNQTVQEDRERQVGEKRKNKLKLEHETESRSSDAALKMGNHAVAGAFAGVFVSLCLHPLDTIKTVLQARSSSPQSLLPTVASIVTARGVSGLYRGLGSNLASSAPISAIYTFTYESVKAMLLPRLPEKYHSLAHCVAGGCASVATSLVYTPSERVKQQMQVGTVYRNSWLAFVGILQKGGLPALYAGWEAVLCRNVPQSVIKFFTYEGLKLWALSGHSPDMQLTTLQTLACGGLAGSTAALFTTPFDVVKTRLQTQTVGSPHQYTSVLNALHRITAEEGIRSLYRGLVPRLAIYVSQGALFFASYEFFKRALAVGLPEAVPSGNNLPLRRKPRVNPA